MVSVDLVKARLIERPTVCWRTATLHAIIGGVSVNYSLAHDVSDRKER